MRRTHALIATIALAGSIACVAGASYLYAQPSTPIPTTDPNGAPPSTKSQTPLEDKARADAERARAEKQTNEARRSIDKSNDRLTEVSATLNRLIHLQQQAHSQKDVIKTNCINDKLLVVKQLENLAEADRQAMGSMNPETDGEEINNKSADLDDLAKEADKAKEGGEVCIGKEIAGAGAGNLEVTKPFITDDPTKDCNFSGDCAWRQPLEYIAFASPFAPK